MKKRITSILLCFCIISGVIPITSMAASDTPMYKVTNVITHITLGGTRYIEYDFNGAHYDSRDCGANFNTNAFKCMNLADQQKVAGWYLPSSERTEQFGETGVGLLCDCINEKTGWAQGFKVIADRIADKYFEELKPIYGGESGIGEDDMYYNLTVKKLTTLTEGSDAHKVYTYYNNTPEAQVFMLKYNAITERMEKGKEAYNACVTDMMKAREAGSKGVGTWLIKFIVSNMITVHGIFTKPVGSLSAGTELLSDAAQSFISDGLNAYIEDIDTFNKKVKELTGIENASGLIIMDRNGAVLDNLYGSGTDIKDAAKLVKQMREHADKSAELAKYCYEEASRYSSQLEGDATQVLRYIEERKAREQLASDQQKWERERQNRAVAESTDDVERDEGYYNAITSIHVSPADDTEEAREAAARLQEELRAKKAEEEWAVVESKVSSWKKSVNNAIDDAVRNVGFTPLNGDEAIPEDESYFIKSSGRAYYCEADRFKWPVIGKTQYGESVIYDLEGWNDRIPDRYMQDVEKVKDDAINFYSSRKMKLEALADSTDSILSSSISSLNGIYALAKGISDAGSYGTFNINTLDGEVKAELYKISNMNSKYIQLYIDICESSINDITDNYSIILEKNKAYKQYLEEYRDEVIELIDNYELSEDAYANAGAAIRKLLNERMPEYVRSQGISPFTQNYVTGAERLNINSNPELKAKIDEAYNRGFDRINDDIDKAIQEGYKEKQKFFRSKATELQPYYEELLSLEKKMSNAYDSAMYYHDRIFELNLHDDIYSDSYDDYNVSQRGYTIYGYYSTGKLSALSEEYHLTNDEQRYKLALKLLLADFKGTGAPQSEFMREYAKTKAMMGAIKRKILDGTITGKSDLYFNYLKDLDDAHTKLWSSSYVPTYSGPYTNIGLDDTMNFRGEYEEIYDNLCALLEKKSTYKPAVALVKGFAVQMSLMSADEADLTLAAGETGKLSVSIEPSDATDKGVIWESLNPEIAEVDENGTVTAYNKGEAVIRATAADAPLQETTDEDGNTTYSYPDEFIVEFTVDVTDETAYAKIDEDEVGYEWSDYGSEETPKYISVNGNTVTAKFNGYNNGLTVIMAVYGEDGALAGVSTAVDNSIGAQTISVSASNTPARVKLLIWDMDNIEPMSGVVIDEDLTASV